MKFQYDIYHCCVYSEKTPDDGQRSCPKHVDFYSKNKFEKLVHLVGFIIRIYHYAQSPEHQFITMHSHLNISLSLHSQWTSIYHYAQSMNINLSLCTVTWTSIYHYAQSMNINLSLCTVTWTSTYHYAQSMNINLSLCTVTLTSIYHYAQSMDINLSLCTVTWTSICHYAQSPEHQFVTARSMNINLSLRTVNEHQFIVVHGHLNINLSWCTVTGTSIYYDAQSPECQIPSYFNLSALKFLFCVLMFIIFFWEEQVNLLQIVLKFSAAFWLYNIII